MLTITNATKANIIGALNAVLALAILFGVPLTTEQIAGIAAAVNSVLVLWVGLTYKQSAKRIAD